LNAQDVLPPEDLAEVQPESAEEPAADVWDALSGDQSVEETSETETPADVAYLAPEAEGQQEEPPLEETLHAEERKDAPPAAPPADVPMGSLAGALDLGTQDLTYLGGMPLDLSKPAPAETRPAPAPPPPAREVEQPAAEVKAPKPAPPPPAAPKAKPAMKIPPRPRLPAMNEPASGDTILPGLDANFPASPSVEAFQGLAMPPVRDVFSSMPAPAPDDPFFGQQRASNNLNSPGGAAVAEPVDPAQPKQEAPSLHPGANGETVIDPAADFFSLNTDPNARRPISAIAPPSDVSRDRKLPGVRSLLLAMLGFMLLGAVLIWFLVPPQYRIEGKLKYKDYAGLSMRQKEALKTEQRQLLGDPAIRSTATDIVVAANKLDAGFLGDGEAFVRILADAVRLPGFRVSPTTWC